MSGRREASAGHARTAGVRRGAGACGPVLAVLETALLLAVCTGLIEGLALTLEQRLGRLTWSGPHILWLSPLSYAAVFSLLALPLAAWTAIGRRPERARRAAEGLFLFLGLVGLAFLVPGLHGAARVLLAAGVAAALLRLCRGRDWPLVRVLRRAAVILLLGAASTLVPEGGVEGPSPADAADGPPPARPIEGRTEAQRPPTRTAGAGDRRGGVNVLLVILDTVRAASLGLYGHDRPTTPTLDRLAAESTVFDRAFAPSPWTLPSHASLFTGRPPHRLSADWRVPLDGRYPTLAEVMTARGYRTAAFVANHYYTTEESGLGRGFGRYDAIPLSGRQALLGSALVQVALHTGERVLDARTPAEGLRRLLSPELPPERLADRKEAPEVTSGFFGWLDRQRKARPSGDGARDAERPFFVFLNYFDAHRPYLASEAAVRRLGPPATSLERYEAAIASEDIELDRLVRGLERRGLLDRTLLIVTSDHGELFDQHGLDGHGNSLYLPLLHVPLLLRLPGVVPEGRRVRPPVTLTDLAATVLDLTGGSTGRLAGTSLRRSWSGAAPAAAAPVLATVRRGIGVPATQPVAKGDMASLLTEDLHYIANGDGREELYAYRTDPEERRDLSSRPAFPARLHAFRTALAEAGVDLGSPRRLTPAGLEELYDVEEDPWEQRDLVGSPRAEAPLRAFRTAAAALGREAPER